MSAHECQAGELLWKIAEWLFRLPIADNGRKPLPLPAREAVLAAVLAHPGGIMLKDLSRTVGRTAGAVSQIIDSLVHEDMVARTVSTRDRRAVTILPTQKCRTIWQNHLSRMNQIIAATLAPHPSPSQTLFTAILHSITTQLSESSGQGVYSTLSANSGPDQ